MSRPHHRGLLLIAIFKFCKGALLLIVSLGLLKLLHRDVQQVLEHVISAVRIDPDNRYVAALLIKAGVLNDRRLEELSALTLLYAALFLTEGVGLFLEKRWAEWLSVVATSALIPIEVYELVAHVSLVKLALLLGNVAIVAFLIGVIRRNHASQPT